MSNTIDSNTAIIRKLFFDPENASRREVDDGAVIVEGINVIKGGAISSSRSSYFEVTLRADLVDVEEPVTPDNLHHIEIANAEIRGTVRKADLPQLVLENVELKYKGEDVPSVIPIDKLDDLDRIDLLPRDFRYAVDKVNVDLKEPPNTDATFSLLQSMGSAPANIDYATDVPLSVDALIKELIRLGYEEALDASGLEEEDLQGLQLSEVIDILTINDDGTFGDEDGASQNDKVEEVDWEALLQDEGLGNPDDPLDRALNIDDLDL